MSEDDSPHSAVPIPPYKPTKYQLAADELSAYMDEFVARLPYFERPHSSTSATIYGYLNLPEGFVDSAVASVEQSEDLQSVRTLDADEGHDVKQFREAFRPLARKVIAIGRALDYTINARQSRLNAKALHIYTIAKGIARDPGGAGVGAHVETMKRELKRTGKRKKRGRVEKE